MGIGKVVIMGILPKTSQHLKDGRGALAYFLAGEEGHGLLQNSQGLCGKKNAVKVVKKTEQIINFLNSVKQLNLDSILFLN